MGMEVRSFFLPFFLHYRAGCSSLLITGAWWKPLRLPMPPVPFFVEESGVCIYVCAGPDLWNLLCGTSAASILLIPRITEVARATSLRAIPVPLDTVASQAAVCTVCVFLPVSLYSIGVHAGATIL